MQKNISIQSYQISRGNQNKLRKKSVVVFYVFLAIGKSLLGLWYVPR